MTKPHRFVPDEYWKNTLVNIIGKKWSIGSHQLANSQKKCEGTVVNPRKKSATAKEITNALVLVRRCRFQHTRRITNPLPITVKMVKIQDIIQAHVSIFCETLALLILLMI